MNRSTCQAIPHGGSAGVEFTRGTIELAAPQHRVRLVASLAFVLLTVAAAILVGRRLTHASWPLDHAQPALAATAALSYFASYLFRARGWHRLFPPDECPDQARCLASVGAAAASGAVLPFRLDYLIKVGMLRKLGGIRVGLEAIVLSIVSLGMIDAIAMLPLSISATATSGSALRGPLLIVVVFGVGCCALLVVGERLIRLPLLRRSRRLRTISEHVAQHTTTRGRGNATVAWFYLFACWSTRAFGSAALLTALGLSFSPTTALAVICLAAAASVIPITSGGVAVGAGATAGILLALGVGKEIAINFSLASGLLLVASALAAAFMGVLASPATRAVARRNLKAASPALVPITTVKASL
jgi:lysylphosphatidylglycerol synthase-like protein